MINIERIINDIEQCMLFSQKQKFCTIDLVNIAFHEAQIKLEKLLKDASDEDRQIVFRKAKEIVQEMVENGSFYKHSYNKANTGIIIQPFEHTDMTQMHQYTLVFLKEYENITA